MKFIKKNYGLGATALFLIFIGLTTEIWANDNRSLEALKLELENLKKEVAELKRIVNSLRSQEQKELVPESIALDADPALGKKTARVALVEFSDFECPYCRKFHAGTFEQLKVKYIDSGKVRYVYRDFPLSFHKNAIPAAVAANCAGAQGGYWVMQRELFRNNSTLSASLYTRLAREMKLNMESFKQCLEDKKQIAEVQADFSDGQKYGVTGTPGFFIGTLEGDHIINVRKITGAQPYHKFESELEAALKQVEAARN